MPYRGDADTPAVDTRFERRSILVGAWAAFMVAWLASAFLVLGLTALVPCGGDGGSPYAAPASPAGRYCETVDAYFSSGEPGELTTALVYLWPVAALGGLGAWGVWKRRTGMLVAIAVLAVAVLAVHLVLSFTLRNRCVPDDPSVPGCAHY
jgi:hypothetical protein